MPTISGGTTGTPVISGVPPSTIALPLPDTVVSLPRYAQLIGYDECGFFGVAYNGQEQSGCATWWTEWQRLNIADALRQAEQKIENIAGYPLRPTWITGQPAWGDARYVDEQPFCNNPIVTRWGMVLQGGVRAETTIQAGALIDYSDEDVSIVGPLPATIGDISEVYVYYPGSERRIIPSKVEYVGGVLTVQIPRCRLVDPSKFGVIENDYGLDKNDLDNFVESVDIRRIYNDPSTHAELVRQDTCWCGETGCTHQTDAACIRVQDGRVGIVEVWPAEYSDGWQRKRTCRSYSHVRLNYQAGLRSAPFDLENMIVRLAHSLLPEEPCGCAIIQHLWKRDTTIPDVLTREWLSNPFGISYGAAYAYQWAKSNALVRGMVV